MENYYTELGVNNNATVEEIKKTFHTLAKRYHPDSGSGNAERFKKINEAYSVLSNPEKRKAYDARVRRETEEAERCRQEAAEAQRKREAAGRRAAQGSRGTASFYRPFGEERTSRQFFTDRDADREETEDPFMQFFSGFWGGFGRRGFSPYGFADDTRNRDRDAGRQESRQREEQKQENRRRETWYGTGTREGTRQENRQQEDPRGKTRRWEGRRQQKQNGAADRNSRATVKISPAEAALGCRKKITVRYKDYEKGNAYAGYMIRRSFLVDIPAGTRDGTGIRLKGAGKPVLYGGTGNVIVTVKLK